jgi:CheY-like chemotaxis protein/HPt (histidine-containing phosphotransfer) domain-containing protein
VAETISSPTARRILIVGDLPLSRGLMKLVLGRLDYIVTCVGTASEAASALSHTDFALILLALKIPDMPGVALARHIAAAECQGERLPMIVFGDAWDQEAIQRECREAGVDAYLQKPISIGRLVATVRELTQRNAATERHPTMTDIHAPIDLTHFRSFTEGDAQLERELGSLYLSTAAVYLDEMCRAVEENRDWRSAAHALKGASANIGARDIAALAERSERDLPSDETLAQLRSSIDLVRAFFERRQRAIAPPDRAGAEMTG